MQQYEDISEEHKSLIGVKFKTNSDMLIYGITLDENYNKVIDYYSIYEYPGINGPEVLSKDIIKSDTTFVINHIKNCTNCLIDRTKILISFTASNKFNNKDIALSREASVNEILSNFERVE